MVIRRDVGLFLGERVENVARLRQATSPTADRCIATPSPLAVPSQLSTELNYSLSSVSIAERRLSSRPVLTQLSICQGHRLLPAKKSHGNGANPATNTRNNNSFRNDNENDRNCYY